MRRREKFVIAAVLLSLCLLGVQYVSLEYRYLAVGVFVIVSYFVSAWSLSDDLQPLEWLTIVPFPALYAGSVGLFYFLLPTSLLSQAFSIGLFGLGMYALYLTSNIYSVAKGRTIQLLHAAHAIGLLFTIVTSVFYTNTLFALGLPFYLNGLLVGLIHFPLILMSLWSVELEATLKKEILVFSALLTLLLSEVGVVLSLIPFSVWNNALFIMALLYIGLGIMHNFLRGRLFQSALNEYSLVAAMLGVIFALFFPWK